MASKLNEIAVGEYKHKDGIVVYGDTDSTYFSLGTQEFKQKNPEFVATKESVIEYVDNISQKVDESYGEHVRKIFNVTEENAKIIRAAREIIAVRGLFVSKKRYALMVYDNEGHRYDKDGKEGKLKIKGLQIQRSDTPMVVRTLLKNMMTSLLTYNSRDMLIQMIKEFYKTDWNTLQPWEKGSPKAVNGLTEYNEKYKFDVNTRLPGHVKASINWNRMCDVMKDTASTKIMDGNKIVVCKLKSNNPFGMTSIAYPRDLATIPQWFKEMPFNDADMTDSVVDTTMDSIFGVLNWNIGLNCINESKEDIEDFLTYV